MTSSEFKSLVAAYINRDVASFTVNGLDLLLLAINDAKRAGQRDFDFPQNQGRAFIQTSYFGTNISNAKTNPEGTGDAVVINHVYAAWRYAPFTIGATNDYIRTQKYEFMSEKSMRDIIPARNDAIKEPNILPITYKQRVYQREDTIFLTGTTEPTWIWLDVVKWLPDYTGSTDTDFFLTYYRDWLLLKTLEQLNLYLKEDQRFQISNIAMERKWNSVLAHANRYVDGHDQSNSLD